MLFEKYNFSVFTDATAIIRSTNYFFLFVDRFVDLFNVFKSIYLLTPKI
jgi:hypothetical protein